MTDKDVMDLEKTYWGLKSVGREKSGKFDLETFKFYASPPVPEEVCGGMYICVYTAWGTVQRYYAYMYIHVQYCLDSV